MKNLVCAPPSETPGKTYGELLISSACHSALWPRFGPYNSRLRSPARAEISSIASTGVLPSASGDLPDALADIFFEFFLVIAVRNHEVRQRPAHGLRICRRRSASAISRWAALRNSGSRILAIFSSLGAERFRPLLVVAGRPGEREGGDGLEQVGLALRVVAMNDIEPGARGEPSPPGSFESGALAGARSRSAAPRCRWWAW